MSWITPTEADILTRVSGAELEAFRAAALGVGQADPVAPSVTVVVDHMRGYIRRCPNHVMGAAGTIPAEALHVFLDLIVPVIQMRPAGAVIDPSGIRLDGRKESTRWLEQVAACEVLFEDSLPATTPDVGPMADPTMCAPRRQRTRRQQDGI